MVVRSLSTVTARQVWVLPLLPLEVDFKLSVLSDALNDCLSDSHVLFDVILTSAFKAFLHILKRVRGFSVIATE